MSETSQNSLKFYDIYRDLNPKSWLSKYRNTSIFYLSIFFIIYNIIGLLLGTLTDVIISSLSPSYQPSLREYNLIEMVAAGPIEDILFFGIPFYLTSNPFALFICGIVWSVMHVFPSNEMIGFNNLYFGQMMFVIPNLFFHYRTWISRKGGFAILSHSVWNGAVFGLCSIGIIQMGIICIQNFQIEIIIGYTLVCAILLGIIYLVYNREKKHNIITNNTEGYTEKEEIISLTSKDNFLQQSFENKPKIVVIIGSLALSFGAIFLTSSVFLLAKSFAGSIIINDSISLNIMDILLGIPYGLFYYIVGNLLLKGVRRILNVELTVFGIVYSIIMVLSPVGEISKAFGIIGIIIGSIVLYSLAKPGIRTQFNIKTQLSYKSKKSKVNVFWQTIIAVIPFVNLWAAERIQNLEKFLLLFVAVHIVISLFVPFPISYIIIASIEIYFIMKWSYQWNNKIDNENISH